MRRKESLDLIESNNFQQTVIRKRSLGSDGNILYARLTPVDNTKRTVTYHCPQENRISSSISGCKIFHTTACLMDVRFHSYIQNHKTIQQYIINTTELNVVEKKIVIRETQYLSTEQIHFIAVDGLKYHNVTFHHLIQGSRSLFR